MGQVMQNQEIAIAKRIEGDLVEYVCPNCGGYSTMIGIFRTFPAMVDHLITALCFVELPELSQPFQGSPDGEVWFRIPDTNDVIFGLPEYEPDSPAWRRFLKNGEKLLPQAKVFLPHIADWLEKALSPIEALRSIERSGLFAADRLVTLVKELPPQFDDQKTYLQKFEDALAETGMDQKWDGPSSGRAGFVARSMAGVRWGLTQSSSREMVRLERLKLSGQRLMKIGITDPFRWWDPDR